MVVCVYQSCMLPVMIRWATSRARSAGARCRALRRFFSLWSACLPVRLRTFAYVGVYRVRQKPALTGFFIYMCHSSFCEARVLYHHLRLFSGWNWVSRVFFHHLFWKRTSGDKLECGPMPNVMAALSNIDGALCSTPQSLADTHY